MKSRIVGIADGDQRLGRPGGDVLLEVEDSRLVDEYVERGVVAAAGCSINESMDLGTCAGRGGASGTCGKLAGISLSSENRGATWSGWTSKGCRDLKRLRCDRVRRLCRWRARGGAGGGGTWARSGSFRPRRDDEGREDQMRPARMRPIACVPSRTKIRLIVGPRL